MWPPRSRMQADHGRRIFRAHRFAGILIGRRADAEHRVDDDSRRHQIAPTADRAAGRIVGYLRAGLQDEPEREGLQVATGLSPPRFSAMRRLLSCCPLVSAFRPLLSSAFVPSFVLKPGSSSEIESGFEFCMCRSL